MDDTDARIEAIRLANDKHNTGVEKNADLIARANAILDFLVGDSKAGVEDKPAAS